VERIEPDWGRGTADANPRWRSLLDRALLGKGGPGDEEYDGRFSEERLAQARTARYPDEDYRANGYGDQNDYREAGYGGQGQGQGYDQGYEPRRDDYGDYPQPQPAYDPRSNGYGYAAVPQQPEYEEYAGYPQANGYEQPVNGYHQEWQQQAAEPEPDPTDGYVETLRRELASPHVLAFANPKGGVHKTTATVLAAATIGSVRGKGVLAWDDNELRGTLGLRAGSARHARTIRHLVRDLVDVEGAAGYDLHTRLDDYLRHASDGTYDVLAGEENPRFAQRLDPYTVKRVVDLLRRTHDVICIDTGNNVESPNWQTVLQAAEQLVVTTVPREDAAFTADWMLDLLDEAGMDDMVSNAVTLLSCPSPNPTPLIDDLAAHFAARTRAVVVVPYDPALESGSLIELSDLQPATRAAWLRAAAVMMDPYARTSDPYAR
jgi:MinD-like ATPase involved in chromosome partitioning or flagellar assembly